VNESDEEFDWDVFKWICKSKPDWKKIWFAKHNARIGSVRTNLVRRKHSEDPTCPCCGELDDGPYLPMQKHHNAGSTSASEIIIL